MRRTITLAFAIGLGLIGLIGATERSDARVFCYNRHTGRFLHWGYCHRYHYYRRHPRVFCYNRHNGRFLHWGHC